MAENEGGAQNGVPDMPNRRNEPFFIPRVSLGNVLTILGGVIVGAGMLMAVGKWVGGIESKIDNQATMSGHQRDVLSHMGDQLNTLSGTVQNIDGKLSSLLLTKHADAGPTP